MAYLLLAVSALAFAYAGRVALGMVAERRAMRDRIARGAVRPVHGGPVIKAAPSRAVNRPGEN